MMSILDDPALDMRVGLANRKRVNAVVIKVTKAVIDEAVGGFVGANGVQNVLHRRVLGKAPVIFGDGRRRHLLPVFQQFCLFLAQTACWDLQVARTTWGDAPSRALQLHAFTSPRPLPRGNRRNGGRSSVR